MTVARREMLVAGSAVAAVAALGLAPWRSVAPPLSLVRLDIAAGGNILFVHDGGADALATYRQLVSQARPGVVAARRIEMLGRGAFDRMDRLVTSHAGMRVVALLGAAEAVVFEGLLQTRRAAGIGRRTVGQRVVLLTATL